MQFSLTTAQALAVLTALTATPIALAADCYSGSRSSCESRDALFKFRQNYCGDTSQWRNAGGQTWGWASLTLRGQFASQQICWDAFENIINQCQKNSAGGKYDYEYDGKVAHLDVHFCLN